MMITQPGNSSQSTTAACGKHAHFFHVRGAEVRTVDKADVIYIGIARIPACHALINQAFVDFVLMAVGCESDNG
ncbi:TPA: hypothetical protein JFB67_002034 [Escherichia coli]|nr:hypothetical protein [Escherichia coli]HAU9634770.1 hypothetical protein [Escherichia coli]